MVKNLTVSKYMSSAKTRKSVGKSIKKFTEKQRDNEPLIKAGHLFAEARQKQRIKSLARGTDKYADRINMDLIALRKQRKTLVAKYKKGELPRYIITRIDSVILITKNAVMLQRKREKAVETAYNKSNKSLRLMPKKRKK